MWYTDGTELYRGRVMEEILKKIGELPYPGRGIVLGNTADGKMGVAVYFLTGRSASSRNRVLVQKGNAIATEFANKDEADNPSLVIYTALRKYGPTTIVTNGDQTETILHCIEREITFEEALRTRTFEPDAPHYTPRISGVLVADMSGIRYKMSIIKAAGGNPSSVERMFFEYPQPLPGTGHYLHTYDGMDASGALHSFGGAPVAVRIAAPLGNRDALGRFAGALWAALDAQNRVSLLVRTTGLDGTEDTCIINKNDTVVV